MYMATFRMYKCECAYKSTMASLMIAPVQRIPRYQLLLRDLMNRTSQTHSDYKNIEEAMKLVMSIAGSINEQMRLMNQRQEYQEVFFLRFRNSSLKYPDKDLFDDQELKKLDPMKCLLKKTNALKVTTNDSTNRVEIFLTESHFAYVDFIFFALKEERQQQQQHSTHTDTRTKDRIDLFARFQYPNLKSI